MNNVIPGTQVSFDISNENWHPQREYNFLFLRATQNYLNDLLRSRGHVFLNDVLDQLGVDRTTLGAITGWVMGEDAHIDLGIWEPGAFEEAENGIILTLNVQGVIYNEIETTSEKVRNQVQVYASYPMLGDGITGLEWANARLNHAKSEGLLTKWEFVSANENASGIIRVNFMFTTIVEYPKALDEEQQERIAHMTLRPILNQITLDTDADIAWVRYYDI